ASPKYLNLEARDEDWKARLWRSLTLARGAVLDVSHLTSYVRDEVRMCYRTLGLDRVLFIGDGSKEQRRLAGGRRGGPGGAAGCAHPCGALVELPPVAARAPHPG